MDVAFNVWDVIDNDTLYKTFQCKNCGGMRLSHRTQTLILISDHTKGVYADSWNYETGVLKYVGEGQVGDQELKRNNEKLAGSRTNGFEVHLFEVFVRNKYLYEGVVTLEGMPYIERHEDINGQLRDAYVFDLRIDPINIATMNEYLRQRFYWIERLGLVDEIEERIS